MRKTVICLAAAALMGGSVSLAAEEETGGQWMREREEYCREGYEDLAEAADKIADTVGLQGTILIAEGDDILFARGYGLADAATGEKNTMQTVYAVGSISKQFTASAVLSLAAEGKISLSDTVDHYLDGFHQASKVTVAELLRMESGLERDFWNIAYRVYGYKNMEQADEFEDARHTPEELIALLDQDDFVDAPGSKYSYSNINYYLLYRIVEEAAQMPFQEYIREHCFLPAGMESAVMDFAPPLANGYYAGEQTRENASIYEGCGTVCASAVDLFCWNRALHGGKILSDAAYRVMTTPSLASYCCGILLDGTVLWHNGQLNGYNAYNGLDTETDRMLIVLSNSRTFAFHGKTADFPAEVAADMLWRRIRKY